MELIDKTWEELGRKLECVGSRVLVRTEAMPEKIGSIYLPPKQSTYYGQLKGNDVTTTGTILNVGPECTENLQLGDKILFKRLVFAYYEKMKDNTFVGWVNEKDVDMVTYPEV